MNYTFFNHLKKVHVKRISIFAIRINLNTNMDTVNVAISVLSSLAVCFRLRDESGVYLV